MKSIVVLSGGQDSMTTFYMARERSEVVHLLHFNYEQTHGGPEKRACDALSRKEGIPLHLVCMEDLFQQVGDSGLFEGSEFSVNDPHPVLAGVPASFVPGRNLLFLTLAAAFACKVGAREIYTGVCQTDYSGYPDCREETIRALEMAVNLGFGISEVGVDHLKIVTPLMNLTKAETFKEAERLGELDWIIETSHTCYLGNHELRHEWGYGCGDCPACQLRQKGWLEYKEL